MNMNEEILKRIKLLEIDCPECESIFDDEQYYCSTCGCEGGLGRINVYRHLTPREPDGGKSAKVTCLKCDNGRVVVGDNWERKCPSCGESQYEYDSRFGGF